MNLAISELISVHHLALSSDLFLHVTNVHPRRIAAVLILHRVCIKNVDFASVVVLNCDLLLLFDIRFALNDCSLLVDEFCLCCLLDLFLQWD
jgi:hypothetical protein